MESLQLFLSILGFCSSLPSTSSDTGHPYIPAHIWLQQRYQQRLRTWEGVRRASWWMKAFKSSTMVFSCILTKGQTSFQLLWKEAALQYSDRPKQQFKISYNYKLDSLWDGCRFVFSKLKEDCSILAFSFASALVSILPLSLLI